MHAITSEFRDKNLNFFYYYFELSLVLESKKIFRQTVCKKCNKMLNSIIPNNPTQMSAYHTVYNKM